MKPKIRVGMLCVFKNRSKSEWSGDLTLPDNKVFDYYPWEPSPTFGSPFVTVIAKRGGLVGSVWISYCRCLGTDKAGQTVILWVQSYALKPTSLVP